MKHILLSDIDNKVKVSELITTTLLEKKLDVEIEYSANFDNSKKIRTFISAISEYFSISSQWKGRLILIIDELSNNSIEYGSKPGEKNIIRVYIKKSIRDINVKVEVEDTGKGEKSKSSKEMQKIQQEKKGKSPLEYKSIRGRGLFVIITPLVDELYFKDSNKGGLIVGIKKIL